MSRMGSILLSALMATSALQPRGGTIRERIDRRDPKARFSKKQFKERMRSKRARKARRINRKEKH